MFGGAVCWWCCVHMSPPLRRPEIPPRKSIRGSGGGALGSARPCSSLGSAHRGSPQAFQSSFLGAVHCCECGGGAPPPPPPLHCCGGGGPFQTFPESAASSSSPQVPPIFVVGVCPQGVFETGGAVGWPPFLKLASQRSVPRKAPLLGLGFHGGGPAVEFGSPFAPGSGDPGTSQLVSWFTCCCKDMTLLT